MEQRFSGIHIHKIQLVFYKIRHVSKFSVALDNYGFLDNKLYQTLFKGKMPSTFFHLNVFNNVYI